MQVTQVSLQAGVDGSERIAAVAKQLVTANRLSDDQQGPITIVQGRLEQLVNLPIEQVGCRHVLAGPMKGHICLFTNTDRACCWSAVERECNALRPSKHCGLLFLFTSFHLFCWGCTGNMTLPCESTYC